MKKENMERIWEELSGGTDGIYQRYLQARELRNREYEDQKQQAQRDYRQEQNRLSAAAKIRDLNTKAALSDQGLARSGESLHAQMMNDYTHSQAAAQAAQKYSDAAKELALNKSKADAESESEMAKEMASLNQALYDFGLEEEKLRQQEQQSLRELEQREKESQRKLKQEQSQWEGDKALEREKLDEQKRQFDQKQQTLTQEEREKYEAAIRELEEKQTSQGTVPDKSAHDLYKDILYAAQAEYLDYGSYDSEEYQTLVSNFVTQKLKQLISDEELDEDYRKSLGVYGMLGGYLSSEEF